MYYHDGNGRRQNELPMRRSLFNLLLALCSVRCRLLFVSASYNYYPSTLSVLQGYTSSSYSPYANIFFSYNDYGTSHFGGDSSSFLGNLIAQYPSCPTPQWIGNGYCEGDDTNNEPCGYDGGDCCSCECSSSDSDCFFGGVDCIDPNALDQSCDPGEGDTEETSFYAYQRQTYYNSNGSHYYDDDNFASLQEEYSNCSGFIWWIMDDYCDFHLNNPSCGFDGGDCCYCNCTSNDSDHFYGGAHCVDPNALNQSCTPADDCKEGGYYNPEEEEYYYNSYYNYTDDDFNALREEYPNCSGILWTIGDDFCDLGLNSPACGYDGGDCCYCNCTSSASDHFYSGVHCIDPNAFNQSCIPVDDCEADNYSQFSGSSGEDEERVSTIYGQYPDCTGTHVWIGDGFCDWENNIPSCGYDGGDCCVCTCVSTQYYECGVSGFFCLDLDEINDASCDLSDDYYSPLHDPEYLAEYIARLEQFPDCHWDVRSIGDGYCNPDLSIPSCGFDGGDCCPCTCVSTGIFSCGVAGYNCTEPNVESLEDLCSPVPEEIPPCSPDLPSRWDLYSPQKVSSFARSILCSGGRFDARWHGSIAINETIYVVNNTKVDVIGVGSDAVADGAGVSRVFTVFDASLNVSDLKFINCSAPVGGAVAAVRSTLTFERSEFLSNRATTYGGALFTRDRSSLFLREDSRFAENNAGLSGGAFFIANGSNVSLNGRTHFSLNRARNSGGAMHVFGTPSVDWNGEVIFTANVAGYGGAVSLWEIDEMVSRGTLTFVENVAEIGSGGAMFIGRACNVRAEGVANFTANFAVADGGAIGSFQSESESNHSEASLSGPAFFVGNECGGSGGAISQLDGLAISFDANNFLNFSGNSANINGGAVYVSGVTVGPRFMGATFIANKAGEDGGGAYIAASGTSEDGGRFVAPTAFFRCNFEGNQAKGNGGAISSSSGVDYIGQTNFTGNEARAGGAIRLAGQDGVVTDCSFIENSADEAQGPAISHAGIQLQVRGCSFEKNFFQCSPGKFVDTMEAAPEARYGEVCADCPECLSGCHVVENATIPICRETYRHTRSEGGKATLQSLHVEQEFWRPTPSSKTILPCYNPKACLGGLTNSSEFCANQYVGPYCAVCAKGFASRIQYTCEKCGGRKSGMALIALVAVIVLFLGLSLVWYLILADNGVRGQALVRRIMRNVPMQSIKTVVVMWQIVTQFASAANVTYPEVYERFLNIVRVLNFELGWALSAACVLDMDFHYRFLFITIGPFVALALLGVTYSIAFFRNRHSPEVLQHVRDKHTTVLLWLTLLIYSSASSAVFRMFACDTLDDNEGYRERFLRADYRINCDSPKHRALEIYAAFMVVVYPVGIPCFYAILLFRERKLLQDGRRRDQIPRLRPISTLWNPYTPQRFYYEVIECVRRMWLAGAVAFIYPNTAAQIAITFVIALVFAFLCEGLAPFASRLDAWVSRTGHAIVFFSMFVALLAKVDVSRERSESQKIFAGVLVGAHVCLVAVIFIEAAALIFWARVREDPGPRSIRVQPLWVSDFDHHHHSSAASEPRPFTAHVPSGRDIDGKRSEKAPSFLEVEPEPS